MNCCQSDTIKQLCGWSFHHYILHDVLDDAREYLLERDMSEHHIAVVIVWESSSHDVLNDAWICTMRYEWTSSMESKDARLSGNVKMLYEKAHLTMFTF